MKERKKKIHAKISDPRMRQSFFSTPKPKPKPKPHLAKESTVNTEKRNDLFHEYQEPRSKFPNFGKNPFEIWDFEDKPISGKAPRWSLSMAIIPQTHILISNSLRNPEARK